MSDKNTDNFDLGDFDQLGASGFTDEIDLTPSEVITAQGGRNSRFIVLATVLALLIMLGAVGIILLAIDQSRKNADVASTAVAIYATNANTPVAAYQTRTAIARTKTPTAVRANALQTVRLADVRHQIGNGLRLLGAIIELTNSQVPFASLANLAMLDRAVAD
jgi:hypothetical protein